MRTRALAAMLFGVSLAGLACQGSDPLTPIDPSSPQPAGLGVEEVLHAAMPDPFEETGAYRPAASASGRDKVEICHFTGNGAGHRIEISVAALAAHVENHGDHVVGAEDCDAIDNDCDGETDEGGVCECPCDFSLPDPPLVLPDPVWECEHPISGDDLHARLREVDTPTKALWQTVVLQDSNDPDLHVCSTLLVDFQGNIVSIDSLSGLDDGQAKGCLDRILENAGIVGVTCLPN